MRDIIAHFRSVPGVKRRIPVLVVVGLMCLVLIAILTPAGRAADGKDGQGKYQVSPDQECECLKDAATALCALLNSLPEGMVSRQTRMKDEKKKWYWSVTEDADKREIIQEKWQSFFDDHLNCLAIFMAKYDKYGVQKKKISGELEPNWFALERFLNGEILQTTMVSTTGNWYLLLLISDENKIFCPKNPLSSGDDSTGSDNVATTVEPPLEPYIRLLWPFNLLEIIFILIIQIIIIWITARRKRKNKSRVRPVGNRQSTTAAADEPPSSEPTTDKAKMEWDPPPPPPPDGRVTIGVPSGSAPEPGITTISRPGEKPDRRPLTWAEAEHMVKVFNRLVEQESPEDEFLCKVYEDFGMEPISLVNREERYGASFTTPELGESTDRDLAEFWGGRVHDPPGSLYIIPSFESYFQGFLTPSGGGYGGDVLYKGIFQVSHQGDQFKIIKAAKLRPEGSGWRVAGQGVLYLRAD